MSNKKEEMITIELIPSDVREFARFDGQSDSINRRIADACQAALDARKSKLDQWREKISEDFKNLRGEFVDSRADILRDDSWNEENIRLMAAAPQLLEALIKLRNWHKEEYKSSQTIDAEVDDAIKLALPDDVADEVLGR